MPLERCVATIPCTSLNYLAHIPAVQFGWRKVWHSLFMPFLCCNFTIHFHCCWVLKCRPCKKVRQGNNRKHAFMWTLFKFSLAYPTALKILFSQLISYGVKDKNMHIRIPWKMQNFHAKKRWYSIGSVCIALLQCVRWGIIVEDILPRVFNDFVNDILKTET